MNQPMPARQVVLLRILVFALTVFLCLAAWRPEWSQTNIVSLVAFSVMLVVIAFLTLAVRNGGSLDGHRGLPRSFWVVFASLTGAFGLAMLLAILGLPWLGYAGFALLLGEWAWWVIPMLAAGLYPTMKNHLR
ncbi:MAG TPA: hypothetical protein VL379_20330 [Pseudomonadales bacterium]|nr:hypothetical protein [Pseudomonadales bacterium]